ncbi:MAG: ABC transporter permease [Zoogloeaceae bacterium]|jgi:peptide/nickel transport system permease protein|nr:ABC transporter permease [Zoogloeaceae bacterium]
MLKHATLQPPGGTSWRFNLRPLLAALRGGLRAPGLSLSLLFVGLLLLTALWPAWLTSADPLAGSARDAFGAPSAAHWLGTDENGRDVLARLCAGARPSLLLGFAATLVGLAGGVLLGLLAGLGGRWLGAFAARGIDVLMAFPDILLALVVITLWGPSLLNGILAIGIGGAPRYARLIGAQVRQVRQAGYVEAAITLGYPSLGIVLRHVLPNAIKPVILLATIAIGHNIGIGATLSFLGFGLPPPTPEWGSMLSAGRDFLSNAWWLVVAPGVVVTLTVVSMTVIGRTLMRISEGKRK